jgi:hypothetical protein
VWKYGLRQIKIKSAEYELPVGDREAVWGISYTSGLPLLCRECTRSSRRKAHALAVQAILPVDRQQLVAPLLHAECVMDVLETTQKCDCAVIVDIDPGAQQSLAQ